MSDNDPRSPVTPLVTPPATPPATPPQDDADAIQADIEQTRERLADTVDQLQAKLDVKSRASAGAHDAAEKAKATVVDSDGRPRPVALGAAGAVLVGVITVVAVTVWRRRQARRSTWERWR